MVNRGVAGTFVLLCLAQLIRPVTAAEPPVPDAAPVPSPAATFEAAKELAADGRADSALAKTREAIAAGYDNYLYVLHEPALAEVRKLPAWTEVIADFERSHPWAAVMRTPADGPLEPWIRYAAARQSIDAGKGPSEALAPTYFQYYSAIATMLGEYDEAVQRALGGPRRVAPHDHGITGVRPAMPTVLAEAKGRRVVMLNEMHVNSATRAANAVLIMELARMGFTHVALEALAYDRVEEGCASSRLADTALAERGHATPRSGHYLNDPILAETLRIALAEGLTPVAYDFNPGSSFVAEREQEQAENLACVVAGDPEARLIVIGGGGHISEQPDLMFPGGQMGHRFKSLTGIDPLTINISPVVLSGLEQAMAGDNLPGGRPHLALRSDGSVFAREGYDLTVFMPPVTGRDEPANWLSLGGHRRRIDAVEVNCAGIAPCLVEAHREDEAADAVAADRCVAHEAGTSCPLFLPEGRYRVVARAPDGEIVHEITKAVR
jgi:hypothetical protein